MRGACICINKYTRIHLCLYGLAGTNWVGPCNVKIVDHLIELETRYGACELDSYLIHRQSLSMVLKSWGKRGAICCMR